MKSAYSVRGALFVRLLLAAMLTTTACLLFSATSNAATVSKTNVSNFLYFYGAGSEVNDVVISDDGSTLTVVDNSATITSVSGGVCTLVNSHTVTCPLANVSKTLVYLYAGNDSVESTTSKALSGYGGNGNDVLTGSTGQDVLRGDAGDDTLAGGANNDTLIAGNDSDKLIGGLDDDNLYGGNGVDSVSYEDRSEPVVVDLTTGGGEDGEYDQYYGDIENAYGGSGDDWIYGGDIAPQAEIWAGDGDDIIAGGSVPVLAHGEDGDDDLRGGGWEDILYGGNGDDLLHGGANADEVYGHAGNDTLASSLDGDFVSGGTGVDTIDYSNEASDVEVNLPLNYATRVLTPFGSDSLASDIESVKTGDGDDLVQMEDDVAGTVTCGAGYDLAYADYVDDADATCEFFSEV